MLLSARSGLRPGIGCQPHLRAAMENWAALGIAIAHRGAHSRGMMRTHSDHKQKIGKVQCCTGVDIACTLLIRHDVLVQRYVLQVKLQNAKVAVHKREGDPDYFIQKGIGNQPKVIAVSRGASRLGSSPETRAGGELMHLNYFERFVGRKE